MLRDLRIFDDSNNIKSFKAVYVIIDIKNPRELWLDQDDRRFDETSPVQVYPSLIGWERRSSTLHFDRMWIESKRIDEGMLSPCNWLTLLLKYGYTQQQAHDDFTSMFGPV